MSSLLSTLKSTDLISPRYREEQSRLHARPGGYGGKGDKWAVGVAGLVARFQATSVLDYGCGQGALKKALRPLVANDVRIDEYDPAIPGKDSRPTFADLLVCTDVLEHVEPDRLGTVLRHLDVLARKALFLVIATRPSNKTLSDGRNAHLIIQPDKWWEKTLSAAGFNCEPGPSSPLEKPSREYVTVITR